MGKEKKQWSLTDLFPSAQKWSGQSLLMKLHSHWWYQVLQMVKTRAVDLRSLPEFKEQLYKFMEDKSMERVTLKSLKYGQRGP